MSDNSALTSLNCASNQLTSLNLRNNTALTYLFCQSNQLTSLNLGNNSALTFLYCYSNQLTALDVSGCTSLKTLSCYSNKLTALNVSNNSSLANLNCNNNQLSSLTLNSGTALTSLNCSDNKLSVLNVSSCSGLTELYCSSNRLTDIDVSGNADLVNFDCGDNQLTELDVSSNTVLEEIRCDNNQISTLDLSDNTSLTVLDCSGNNMAALDLSANNSVSSLECGSQDITVTSLDITGRTDYPYSISFTNIDSSLDGSKVTNLEAKDSDGGTVSVTSDVSAGLMYFAAKPKTVTYDYDTSLSGGSSYMDVTAAVSSDTEAPTLTISLTNSSQTITAGQAISSIGIDVYSYSGTYTLSADELPEGLILSADENVITGIIAAAGDYAFTVTAKDTSTGETASADVSITVEEPPALAVTLTNDDQEITAGEAISTITINVYNSDSYTLGISGLPEGLTSSDNTITGTISTAGDYHFTVTATDTSTGKTASADAAITVNPVPVIEWGITGITLSTSSVTLDSSGGTFSVSLTAYGNASGDVTWNISAISEDLSAEISSTGTSATLSGTAPANTIYSDVNYTIIVQAQDNVSATLSDMITVTVGAAERTNTIDHNFTVPDAVRSKLASLFGSFYQFDDDEIGSDSWEIDTSDLQEIAGRNRSLVIRLPIMSPKNSGVYLLKLTLSAASVGTNINLYGISGSTSSGGEDEEGNTSIAALEDADYVFLDENGNEITTIPEDGVVYAALNLISGTTNRGVVTAPIELKVGTITPVTEEEVETILDKIADTMNISVDAIKFITDENISEAEEPTQTTRRKITSKNASIIGKLNTIEVSDRGYYVFKVELSADLYEQNKGVSVKDLRGYAIYNTDEEDTETSEVRASLPLIGALNTLEFLSITGDKLEFSAKTFLMAGLLNAGTPLSVYLAKIFLLLLGGCDTGLGLAGLAVLGLSAIYFAHRRKH